MTNLIPFACAVIMLGAGGTWAAAPDSGELQDAASRQEQIRGDAHRLLDRLDEITAEYARNGIAKGEDFDDLTKVRATLGTLSDEEMEKVVALLKEADEKPSNSGDKAAKAAKAYAGEKDISLRLKEILAAHQREQDLDALASAVSQLAERQGANLSTAIDVKQLAAQDQSTNGQAAVAASEEAQQGEQTSIAGEVKLNAEKLDKIAADAGSQFKDAAAQLAGAATQATAASGALGDGKIDDAVASETAVREKLRKTALTLTPADKQQRFAGNEAGQLASLAQEQKALLGKTVQLTGALKAATTGTTAGETDKAMLQQFTRRGSKVAAALASEGITATSPVDQIRNAPEMQKFLATRADTLNKLAADASRKLTALAGDQSAITSKAQMVQGDFEKSMGQAAKPMADAVSQMNAAKDALAKTDGEQAARSESFAATQLANAAKLAAENGAPAQSDETPQQQLAQLQREASALASREAASIQHGDAQKTGPAAAAAVTAQQDLALKTEELQQRVAAQGSPGSQELQQAADAINNAAKLMQQGGLPTIAQSAQQAAVDALGKAARQLGQQTEGAAQKQRDLAAMERQMQGLAKLIDDQRHTNLLTGKAMDQPNLTGRDARMLAHQQSSVQNQAEGVRKAAGTNEPELAKDLDKAKTGMGDAIEKLGRQDLAEATAAQKAVLNELYKAQDAFADKMQKTAQEVGQSEANPKALAAVESQLATVNNAVDMANTALSRGKANMGQVRSHMSWAEQRAAEVGSKPQVLSQEGRDAIRQAAEAAGEAADAASSGRQQQAAAQTAQARKALAALQTALGQMEAGVGDLSAPAEPESQTARQDPQGSGQSMQRQPASGGQPPASPLGTGANEKNWSDTAGGVKSASAGGHGSAQFLGLPDRDRGAIQQSQSEKYPQEYGTMVEEYMRSLAVDSGAK